MSEPTGNPPSDQEVIDVLRDEIDALKASLFLAAVTLQTYRRDTGTPDVYGALDVIAEALGYESREELPK